jgi:hypothetical protein
MAPQGKKTRTPGTLSATELQALESLAERGVAVAIPAQRNAKPREVVAVSLADDGRRVLLYLSKETTEI